MSPRAFDRVMISLHIATHPKFAALTNDELLCFVTGMLPVCQQSTFRGYLIVGDRPASVEDIRAQTGRRVTAKVVKSTLEKLREVGVIFEDLDLGAACVHDFEEWNPAPKIDRTNTERQARYRARHNGVTKVPGNGVTGQVSKGVSNGTVTPTEEEEGKKTPHSPQGGNPPPDGFEQWLADHHAVTGHQPPGRTTKAFATIRESYRARIAEKWTLDDLIAATLGAHNDDYRRQHGYDTASSILKPTKVGDLVARGRRHQKAAPADTGNFLAKLRGDA